VPTRPQNTYYRTKSTERSEDHCSNLESNQSTPHKNNPKLRIDYNPNITNRDASIKESRYRNNIIQSFRQQKKFLTLEVRDVDVDYENVCPSTKYSKNSPRDSPRKSKRDYILDKLKDKAGGSLPWGDFTFRFNVRGAREMLRKKEALNLPISEPGSPARPSSPIQAETPGGAPVVRKAPMPATLIKGPSMEI